MPGGTPLAVAVFVTDPAASSAAVIVYTASAVQVSESPVARVGSGHVIDPTVGSETLMLESGRTPVLVTVNVKAIVSPASVRPLPFTSVGPRVLLQRDVDRLGRVRDRAVDEVADAQRDRRRGPDVAGRQHRIGGAVSGARPRIRVVRESPEVICSANVKLEPTSLVRTVIGPVEAVFAVPVLAEPSRSLTAASGC